MFRDVLLRDDFLIDLVPSKQASDKLARRCYFYGQSSGTHGCDRFWSHSSCLRAWDLAALCVKEPSFCVVSRVFQLRFGLALL